MSPYDKEEVIEGRRYSTKTATLLAGNDYWDGHNWERSGTNQFLYRTPRGRYFTFNLTQWEGQRDTFEPCDEEAARGIYEGLSEKRVSYEEAFPHFKVEEA
ncbi:MAG: hypothetical protein SAMD01599839_05810 [Rectinema sp.]